MTEFSRQPLRIPYGEHSYYLMCIFPIEQTRIYRRPILLQAGRCANAFRRVGGSRRRVCEGSVIALAFIAGTWIVKVGDRQNRDSASPLLDGRRAIGRGTLMLWFVLPPGFDDGRPRHGTSGVWRLPLSVGICLANVRIRAL